MRQHSRLPILRLRGSYDTKHEKNLRSRRREKHDQLAQDLERVRQAERRAHAHAHAHTDAHPLSCPHNDLTLKSEYTSVEEDDKCGRPIPPSPKMDKCIAVLAAPSPRVRAMKMAPSPPSPSLTPASASAPTPASTQLPAHPHYSDFIENAPKVAMFSLGSFYDLEAAMGVAKVRENSLADAHT